MFDPIAPLRAEIMAQPERDRVEYALELLRFYLAPVPEFFEGCARLGLGLSLRDVRMLHALDRRRGRFVSLDALQAAEMVDCPSDDWGTPDAIYRRLSKIRRRLTRSPAPVEICGWRSVGFKLVAPAAFRFEVRDQIAVTL